MVRVYTSSSTLANEASDFLSVANQLAASSSLRLLPPSPLFFLSLPLFVFCSQYLIKHDRYYSFGAFLALWMTIQSGSER